MERTSERQEGLPAFSPGKYFVKSIGCIESNLAGSLYFNYFQENHWSATERPEEADLIIVVTCGVTKVKMDQSLSSIHQLEKVASPHGFIVVAGCIPKIIGEELQRKVGAKTIITPSPQDVEKLIKFDIPLSQSHANFVRYKYMRMRMKFVLALRKIIFAFERRKFPLPTYLPLVFDAYEDPRWYYVSVGSGCLHKCAFCAIKFAKGDVKSRSLDIILREIEAGVAAGHKKIVLAGDDTGAYGQDIGMNFVELLKKITNLPGDFQIYIRNLEPFWLMKYFEEFCQILHTKKIRAITVPIQSGNDRVLQAMKRGHKIVPLKENLRKLNLEAPDLLILTHFMVGLPGEDNKAFKDSLQLLKEVRFSGVAPDRFYPHPRTASATMDGQVSELIKWWRYLILTADIIWSVYFNRGKLMGSR